MARIVISYPRENRAQQESLVRHLRRLGHSVFVDRDLAGSVEWWPKVLDEIRSCDALVCIISTPALNSVACQRERSYAFALRKPILPIAVEPLTQALPRELSVVNVVDYSAPNEEAAFSLAAALGALPVAPALPSPLPEEPAPPLSYLSDLIDAVDSPTELPGDEQWRLFEKLQPALNSADSEERQGAWIVLDKLSRREELRAGIEHRIRDLQATSSPSMQVAVPARAGGAGTADRGPAVGVGTDGAPPPPPPGPAPVAPKKRSKLVTILAVIGAVFVLLVLVSFCSSSNDYDYYYGWGASMTTPYASVISP